ncbi:MAG TPA: protein-glutamate O-methyltransferase CheR [Planctomycetota bacterium]|nr:protein-glutamate O-methyltransferase CheR [Planctomycetota bacterium]
MGARPSSAGYPGRRRHALTRADHEFLRMLLHQRTGILLDPSREHFAEMRLGGLANDMGFESLPDVLEAVRTEEHWGQLHRLVVEALAISETSWFRDAQLWSELRESILPGLLERRRASRTLNVWSAACASGQEPYSLAMLLHDMGERLAGWQVRLLATDFSQGILKRARTGSYSPIEMNRGLPAPQLVRHFRKDADGAWELRPEVRARVEFRELNLAVGWPEMPAMDLVLLRNVLLYFEPELRRRVLRQLARLLTPDGVLVLGAGETTLTMDDSFEAVPLARTVVYRRREAA